MPAEETEVVRPLTSEEIKTAIAQMVGEQVYESLGKNCWLFGSSWPKFKAKWRIDLTLENFGEERDEFVQGQTLTHEIRPGEETPTAVNGEPKGETITVESEVPYTPPNRFRRDNGLPVPTVVKRDDGSTEQKAVVYKRKPGRPRKDDQ